MSHHQEADEAKDITNNTVKSGRMNEVLLNSKGVVACFHSGTKKQQITAIRSKEFPPIHQF